MGGGPVTHNRIHGKQGEKNMGYQLTKEGLRQVFAAWSREYDIYAPKRFEGTGRFSETDVIRYGTVSIRKK